MKTALKIVAGLVGLVAVVVFLTLLWAGAQDGPPAPFLRGGAFTTGTLYTGPEPDWSPMRTRGEVEFQILVNDTSRITWIAEHENKIYILSGYMNTPMGTIWKHWPHQIVEDNRIVLRVDDTLYERQLDRIMEGPMVAPVVAMIVDKYLPEGADFGDPDEAIRNGDAWLYEVAPRS